MLARPNWELETVALGKTTLGKLIVVKLQFEYRKLAFPFCTASLFHLIFED